MDVTVGHKEGWVLKNWCFWTVLLEKTPESPLDSKEIQPVHPKGDQSSVITGRTDIEAETPILCPPDATSGLIWKDSDVKKIEGRRRRWRQKMRWLDGITDSMDMSWVNSRSWWWTARTGVLLYMGSQWVGHDWGTELNWTERNSCWNQCQRKLSRLSQCHWGPGKEEIILYIDTHLLIL